MLRRLAIPIALVLAVSASSSGCGGALMGETTQAITIGNDVTVAITPPPDVLPFNPRAARIQVATQKLSAEAGHPITLQIDQALITPSQRSFEEQLAEAIESIAIGLRDLQKARPRAFAREVPRLSRVECHYDATAQSADADFQAARGTLVVVWPPNEGSSLVTPRFVSGALDDAFDRELDATYAQMAASAVPRDRWAEYFDWVVGHHPQDAQARAAERARSEDERFASDPRAIAAARVLALSRVVNAADPALARRIDEHLAGFGRYLASAYDDYPERVRAAPQTSPFRLAEAGFGAWASARMPALESRVKRALVEAVFEGGWTAHDYLGRARSARGGEKALKGAERFPGFDVFAFGLASVDAWIAAGHPRTGDEHDEAFEAMRLVVCPFERDARGKLDYHRGCSDGFLFQALDDAASAQRLAEAITKRGDGPWLESIVANVAHADDAGHAMRSLLDALGPHAREWRAAMIELVEDFGRDASGVLKAEAQRAWAATPDRRGTSLYVLARLDRSYDPHYTNQWWGEFPKKYGGPVDATLFASMLDQSPRAMQVVPLMWPALGGAYSRAEAIDAHVGGFLAEPMIRDGDSGDPGRTLRAIVDRLCEGGAAASADLAKLHAALSARTRAATGSNSARALENLVVDTAPGHCPAPHKRP